MSTFFSTDLPAAQLDEEHSTAQFPLGTRCTGNIGTEWVYVKLTTACTAYDTVAITGGFAAAPVTSTTAGQGYRPGFAQRAYTVNYYGWVATSGAGDSTLGGLKARCTAATVKDSQLYVGTTAVSAGCIGSTSATGRVLLNGVVTSITAASAGVKPYINASAPWFTP